MPIPAQDIIRRAAITLQDDTSVRWPAAELVRYLNDAQREVLLHRPDALAKTVDKPLTPGSRQSLPPDGAKLLEVVRNTGGRAMRLVNREILDAQLPGWRQQTGTTQLLHFMFDVREPTTFYVYPPAAPGASVELIYAANPTDFPEPPEGSTWQAVTGTVQLPDVYGNALVDYLLYRAYTKDSEYAGNMQRAQMHYGAFAQALGLEIRGTASVAPMSPGNPNTPEMPRAV